MKKQKNNQPHKGKNQQKQHDKQNESTENQDDLPNVEPDDNTNF